MERQPVVKDDFKTMSDFYDCYMPVEYEEEFNPRKVGKELARNSIEFIKNQIEKLERKNGNKK